MSTLLLRLSAPMQSWGISSMYDNRTTYQMPTKSGVVGMIASALGRKRGEPLDDLTSLRFGVRIDEQGVILSDFQINDMVSRYPFEKKAYGGNVSTRYYLSDATFLVGLETEDKNFLEEIAYALSHPVFPLSLGRRAFPPTFPINMGIKDTVLYTSLLEEAPLTKHKEDDVLRIFTEVPLHEDGILLKDVPVSFSIEKKVYKRRKVREFPAKRVHITPIEAEEHDAFEVLR